MRFFLVFALLFVTARAAQLSYEGEQCADGDAICKLEAKLQVTADKLTKAITEGKQGVLKLFTEFRQLSKDLKEAGGKAKTFAATIAEQVRAALQKIKNDHLTPTVKLIKEFFNKISNRGTTTVAPALNDETDIVSKLEKQLQDVTAKMIKSITEGKAGLLKLFSEFRQLYKDLSEHGGNAATFAKGLAAKAREAVEKAVNEHFSPALRLVKSFLDKIFKRGPRTTTAAPALNDETDKVKILENKLHDVADKLINAITKGKAGVSKFLVEFKQLYKDLAELGGPARAYAKELAVKVKAAVEKAKKEHITPAVQLVKSFLKKIFGKDIFGTTTAAPALNDETDTVTKLEIKLKEVTNNLVDAIENGKKGTLKLLAEFRKLYKDLLEIDGNAKTFAAQLADKVKEAIQKLKDDHVTPAVKAVQRFMCIFNKKLCPPTEAPALADETNTVTDLKTKLHKVADNLINAITKGKAGISKFLVEFEKLYKDLAVLGGPAKAYAKELAAKVKVAVEKAKTEHIKPAVQRVIAFLKTVFGKDRRAVTDTVATLEGKLKVTTTKLVDAIENGKQGVLKGLAEFRQLYKDLLEIDGNAKTFVAQLADKVKEAIEKLKNDHVTPAVKAVQRFLCIFFKNQCPKDQDDEIHDVVELRRRGLIGDLFGKVVDTAKDIANKLLTGLHGKFKELGQFLVELTKAHIEKAKPHVDNIKQLAKEFMGHVKEATFQTLEEAKEFFGAYKGDLGTLWKQLLESINTAEKTLKGTTAAPPAY